MITTEFAIVPPDFEGENLIPPEQRDRAQMRLTNEYHEEIGQWTDLAFAGYHILVLAWFIKLPWLIIAFVVLTIAAYIWRYMAFKLKGLAIPLLSHIIADISIIAVIYVLIQ